MIRWLRITLPPGSWIGAFALMYLLPELTITALTIRLEFLARPPLTWQELFLAEIRTGTPVGRWVLVFAAVAYGLYRALYFHAWFRPGYREWLRLTPWTWRAPLPLGPLALAPQDAIIPAVLSVLALRHEEMHYLAPPLIAGAAYMGILSLGFLVTGQRSFGYAVAFALGLMMRLARQPWPAAAVAVATYLVCYWRIRRMLAAFPWSDRPKIKDDLDQQKQQGDVGWPFNYLRPAPPSRSIRWDHGLLISLLVGWLLYASAANIEPRDEQLDFLRFVCSPVVPGAAFFRLLVYLAGHLPPISFWGRLLTMRWIIPGYDQIFIAPLAILLVGVASHQAWKTFDPLIVEPVTVSLCLLIAFNAGPSLLHWRMTGKHRIVPWLVKGQYQKI